jgi:hypothetical protein
MVYTLEMYLASVRDGQWFDFSNHNDKSYRNLIVHEGNSKPTEQECIDGVAALQTAWDSQEYTRNRTTAYPSTGDQLDYIYHNGVAKWKTDMIDPVKTKYPKA